MKIHVFPPSGRIVGIVDLKNYLALDCDVEPIDLGRGDQRAPEYVSLNPNSKIPTLEDDGIVLWESNAILFYMASKRPGSPMGGLLPTAERLELPVERFPEICRWYEGLASLPAWREALAARDAALASWLSKRAARCDGRLKPPVCVPPSWSR